MPDTTADRTAIEQIAAATPYEDLFAQALDPAHRHDPYPIFAALRRTPVGRQSDGTWVVSGYDEISALLHDPRISSDMRGAGQRSTDNTQPSLILKDPPEHDRLRAAVMAGFTPQVVRSLRDDVGRLVGDLLDRVADPHRIDVVDEVAYPLPVTVICTLLGIPPEDESRFHAWADQVARNLDRDPAMDEHEASAVVGALGELYSYLDELTRARAAAPGDDLISRMVTGGDHTEPLTGEDLVITTRMLLVAGHETTVNLITHGVLTLLRHPEQLARLRADPELVVPMTEELVRYQPSVQFRYRVALDDIEVGGITIPRGATVVLLFAAGNRDHRRFADAESFVPDRTPNEHFGFGGGIHYCIGAPLARMEVHIALTEIVRRLEDPRLLQDPPPYRRAAALRGPRHLWLDTGGIRPA